ncbi:pilus assembly protein [Christensenellaceae bacterium]|nr:pilus assembly protein [Christensenellaceae bacterium]BDF61929.1 pilus assembly protein [Christensenellaceae bacterium]
MKCTSIKGKYKLSDAELSAFCEQLAYMIKSGISLQEGLMLLGEEESSEIGAQVTLTLLDTVEQGGSLACALRATDAFPRYMVNMVEIGEASGKLEDVLSSLCAYYERQENIARSIKSAVTYPLVMIAMMIAVILVVIIEVLPVFANVFAQLGSEMSGFVSGVMQFGGAVSRYAVVIVAVAAAVIVLFFILRRTRGGKRFLAAVYERLFRKTSLAVASGRFASAMALMLGSGMDVDQALDMTLELIDNHSTRQKVTAVRQRMESGEGFAEAVAGVGLFSGLYGKMITIGFRTGTLPSVMKRIAQHYEEEADRKMNGILSALEPTLVAVLSLIVGLILLSVMLPLMGVMSAIG